MQEQLKTHQKNECAFFANRICDRCRANQSFRVILGNKPVLVYCSRLAANLLGAEAERLKTEININRIEGLLRYCEENLQGKPAFIGDKKPTKIILRREADDLGFGKPIPKEKEKNEHE